MEQRHEPHSPDPTEPVQLAHRTTNFFIDDILRPDFGCRKEREADRDEQAANKPTPPGTPLSECYNDTSSSSSSSTVSSSPSKAPGEASARKDKQQLLWPAWVYCTRYSDRPSSGPRTRKLKKKSHDKTDDKRPRTAFTTEQLQRLKTEFQVNRYITEQRRQTLAQELNLNESQIKIWFQNKRAKIKKSSGYKNSLALQLMAQGLYNHSTTTVQEEGHD